MQGSQWDRNDYYFEIGVAEHKENCTTPTLLHWLSCHRCEGNSGERNVLPSEAMKCVSNTFRDIIVWLSLKNSYKIIMQRKSQISIGFEPLKPISKRRQSWRTFSWAARKLSIVWYSNFIIPQPLGFAQLECPLYGVHFSEKGMI